MGSETDANPISTIHVGIGGVKSGHLPPKLLEELGLEEGDEIEWRIEDGELVGSPVDDDGIDSVDEEPGWFDDVMEYLEFRQDALDRGDSFEEMSESAVHDWGATMTNKHPRSDVIPPFNIDADDVDISAGGSGGSSRPDITESDVFVCADCGTVRSTSHSALTVTTGASAIHFDRDLPYPDDTIVRVTNPPCPCGCNLVVRTTIAVPNDD